MVRIEGETDRIRATDVAKRSVAVEGEFTAAADGPALTGVVDDTAAVTASRLVLDQAYVFVENLDTGATRELGSDAGPLQLGDASYQLRVETPVKVYLRFDGSASVAKPEFDAVVVEFAEPTPVTLGFRSQTKLPRESMTVPRTPAGVATALSVCSRSHRTERPDRSFPSMRNHPPTIRFGETTDLPERFDSDGEDGGVRSREDRPEIVVPPSLERLIPVAPLAHYLGARVRTELDANPRLIAGGEWDLAADGFERTVASILRRVFYLDCLTRTAGPHGSDLVEADLLEAIDLSATSAYDLPMAERVARYMAVEYDRIAADLPEWHLSMYLAPTFESVSVLPRLLFNVPQVFSPDCERLPGSEWLSRSLDDFYRGRDSVSVDVSKPSLGSGRTHGWLGEGAPIDVFKALPEAYENRPKYYERADDPISIVAVVNEPEMATEGSAAAEIYRRRAAELDLDVTVREGLSVAELEATFETPHDFVHFIGHCEPDGLVCRDGHFTATDLSESNVQTFFLNACGSYYEGIELVRKGSVAGGVTFNRVLDDNAARVGTSFARLLMNGFAIDRAMTLARRRVMAGKDYLVVGDGTHALTQKEGLITTHAEVDPLEEGYRVVHEGYTPRVHGGIYQSHLQTDDRACLYGTRREFVVDADRLTEFLRLGPLPVVYDGDLHWSSELVETL